MRRKKENKRILRSGNGRQQTSGGKLRRNKSNTRQFAPVRQHSDRGNRHKRKTNMSLVLIMIIALIAFVIGAGMGVSLSFDDNGDADGPHFKNVTKEMTNNLNDTDEVYYDKTLDSVDFNENNTSPMINQYQTSEN